MALPLSYNWRNLFVRKTTTIMTILVIAAVVGVFAWLLGFRDALSKSLSFASDRQKLIGEEASHKPLSDSKIAKTLSNQGIQVARRTVAKYRESLGIPPSNERKRLT